MLKLDPPPKVITFDCYGTLVRWRQAVRQAVFLILEDHQSGQSSHEQATAISNRVRELAGEQQRQIPFIEYQEVLQTSLQKALHEAGYRSTGSERLPRTWHPVDLDRPGR